MGKVLMQFKAMQELADSMMQQARKLVAAEWLSAALCCDLTFQLIKMLSEQARVAAGV